MDRGCLAGHLCHLQRLRRCGGCGQGRPRALASQGDSPVRRMVGLREEAKALLSSWRHESRHACRQVGGIWRQEVQDRRTPSLQRADSEPLFRSGGLIRSQAIRPLAACLFAGFFHGLASFSKESSDAGVSGRGIFEIFLLKSPPLRFCQHIAIIKGVFMEQKNTCNDGAARGGAGPDSCRALIMIRLLERWRFWPILMEGRFPLKWLSGMTT